MATLSGEVQDLLQLARDKFIAGDYKATQTIIAQILPKNDKIPEVFQMLATIFYSNGQFNKAIKTFKRALEIDPYYTDASVGLSIILNDLGRYEEGRKIFLEAQSLLERKNRRPDPSVNDKIAAKYEELGDLLFQCQRYEEALEHFQKAFNLSQRKQQIGLTIVECLTKVGQKDKALRELKSLVKEFPQFIAGRNRLASLLYEMNKVAEAIQQWETVLAKDAKNPEATKNLKMAQTSAMSDLF
jgi:tetratricopeptide (TPR) repeat protein